MKIVSNCPLCEEHSLHVIGEVGTMETQQCISCGYATTNNFVGNREDNEMYKTLSEEMQSWSKEESGRIWIPSMITLPFGTLYPLNVDNMVNHKKEMKWAFAEMVDIPEEEQKNYPREDNNGYYNKKYDTDNNVIFDNFLEALSHMNEKTKQKSNSIKLPKLKKM